jgi:hypothetical protein
MDGCDGQPPSLEIPDSLRPGGGHGTKDSGQAAAIGLISGEIEGFRPAGLAWIQTAEAGVKAPMMRNATGTFFDWSTRPMS